MAKIKLIWVKCPKCEGEGGWQLDGVDGMGYEASGWMDCRLCNGEGKTQMGITEQEVKDEERP